ncbi:protein of unknown function [Paraburkholderia dioscoreae]|uniref:Uncharacterized protein n=1 Tax=Paraburkholderia dioscoreae TaxID=2604047 RepID=A0A5Q4ZEJ2_9BURK|nr:protein of unknown function [Paraburkholderia dioscoreae]
MRLIAVGIPSGGFLSAQSITKNYFAKSEMILTKRLRLWLCDEWIVLLPGFSDRINICRSLLR